MNTESNNDLTFINESFVFLTWNVNGKLDTIDNVYELIRKCFSTTSSPSSTSSSSSSTSSSSSSSSSSSISKTELPSFLCVGLQEMVELNAINVVGGGDIFGNEISNHYKAWKAMLEDTLDKIVLEINFDSKCIDDENYVIIEEINMVGLSLFIFSKKRLRNTYIANNENNMNKLYNFQRKIINDVRKGTVVRGVGGILGNKGATVIRFRLYDTSICIVNAHLAHGRTNRNLKSRNSDHESIINSQCLLHEVLRCQKYMDDHHVYTTKLPTSLRDCKHESLRLLSIVNKINKKNSKINIPLIGHVLPVLHYHTNNNNTHDDNSSSDSDSESETNHDGTPIVTESILDIETKPEVDVNRSDDVTLSPTQHDILFFMGDLNYRIASDVTIDEAYAHIYPEPSDIIDDPLIPNITQLFEHDQLHQELLEQQGSFRNFNEGKVLFNPSYKYIPGTHDYDRRPEKKMRCPAWCDRVLWKQVKNGIEKVTLQSYECIDSPAISDHKPVVAKFIITAKQVNWEGRDFKLEQALKKGSPFHISYPYYLLDSIKNSIKIEPSFLSFITGDLVSKTITITSTYDTSLFISLIDESEYKSPSWIKFHNLDNGTVLEKESKIELISEINQVEATNALNNCLGCSISENYNNPALSLLRKFAVPEISSLLYLRVSDNDNKEIYIDITIPITIRNH